jgi:hypothetical protein
MAQVATVRIRHRSGKLRIINAADYVQHIQTYANKGWRVVGDTRGEDDAPIVIRGATMAETDERPIVIARAPEFQPDLVVPDVTEASETVAQPLPTTPLDDLLAPTPRQRRTRKRDVPADRSE